MRRGYRHYDNRTTVQDVLKKVILVLVCLLVLAVVMLLWGRQYIVQDPDGHIRLEIPFLQRDGSDEPDDPLGPVNIQIVTDKNTPQQSPPVVEPPVEPDPPEPEPEPWMRAVSLTLTQLEQNGIEAVPEGANTVVLNIKQDDGYLNYISQLPMAATYGLSAKTDRAGPLVELLHENGYRAVARVSCFRDNALGLKRQYAILTNSGYLWCYDNYKLYWTSPVNTDIRTYLAGVAGELAALGFDEILLDNCGYPTSGNVEWIRRGDAYDPKNLNVPIDALLEEIVQALEGTDTVLAVRTTTQVLLGEDKLSGQTAAGLEQAGVRLWLTGDGVNDPVEQAREAGISDPESRVVAAGPEFGEDERHQSLS